MPPTQTIIPPVEGHPYAAGPVDKRSETISGGPGVAMLGVKDYVTALQRRTGQVQRRYGDRVYDLISLDPVAGGSVDLLVYAALANEPQVVPRHRARPGRATEDPGLAAKEALSREVADFVSWTLEHLETPMGEVDVQLTREALEYGASLGEMVWEIPDGGPYADGLVLKAIKPKPRRVWSFAVNAFWDVKGILASYPTLTSLGGWQLLPREKFVVRTWGSRGYDPRGTSIYDRAAEAWNFRAQLPYEHFKFCKRHASPRPFAKLSQESVAFLGTNPDGSYSHDNATAAKNMLQVLINWINGQCAVIGAGDDITIPDPKTDGAAFSLAMDLYRREIVLAILLQARATMEAEHSSKADSQSSSDWLGNLIRFLKRWVEKSVEWDVLYKIVSYRFGKDVADEHTPAYDLGATEHQDMADLIRALAPVDGFRLFKSQLPDIFAEVGLPVPDMDEIDEEEAKDDAARQAMAGATTRPPDGSDANAEGGG